MAGKREVTWMLFGTGKGGERENHWVVIDDRIAKGDHTLNVTQHSAKLVKEGWWNNVSWSPIALIPIDGRFTPDEYKKRAQIICDTLNAAWVKDELEG